MTANLLAHTDLFAAGIARSGAYNRSLTPFGFQTERRSYWEATDLYTKMSPFTYANKINEPILLIHGEADNNSGTFPIQSERLFQAIKGNGGNCAAGHVAAREPRLPRPRIGPARPGRDVRLGRPLRQESSGVERFGVRRADAASSAVDSTVVWLDGVVSSQMRRHRDVRPVSYVEKKTRKVETGQEYATRRLKRQGVRRISNDRKDAIHGF